MIKKFTMTIGRIQGSEGHEVLKLNIDDLKSICQDLKMIFKDITDEIDPSEVFNIAKDVIRERIDIEERNSQEDIQKAISKAIKEIERDIPHDVAVNIIDSFYMPSEDEKETVLAVEIAYLHIEKDPWEDDFDDRKPSSSFKVSRKDPWEDNREDSRDRGNSRFLGFYSKEEPRNNPRSSRDNSRNSIDDDFGQSYRSSRSSRSRR